MSQKAIDELDKVRTDSTAFKCQTLIDNRPVDSLGVAISDFIAVDKFAKLDFDEDGKWDEIALPLFPTEKPKSKATYQAVIVCFRGVSNREDLREILSSKEVKAEYWAGRQNLDDYLKTQLAVEFINMDFANSPVVYVGYPNTSPLLGDKTLTLSYVVGGGALAIAALAFLLSIVMSLIRRKPKQRSQPFRPNNNLAGLPSAGGDPGELTGGVLDKVRSVRDTQPET